ncbi:hypothetical protein QTN25_000667 [Entamoeba marina]
MNTPNTLRTHLEKEHLFIISKYFKLAKDFINTICVNSKFKSLLEDYHYNPIPIKSLKLFPNIDTQYWYYKADKKVDGIKQYVVCYNVIYDDYMKHKESGIQCRNIEYTKDYLWKYGDAIPKEVNSLGCEYFKKQNLVDYQLPVGITALGVECFCECTLLSSVELGTRMRVLSDGCFMNCFSLKSIDLSYLTSIGNDCFSHCTSLTSLSMPLRIKEIPYHCFSSCEQLSSIQLSDTVTSLGDYSFDGCNSLTNVHIPQTLRVLGKGAFSHCTSLLNIILPDTLLALDEKCFEHCSSLQPPELRSSITSIGALCFTHCNQNESIAIPSTVTSIADNAFESGFKPIFTSRASNRKSKERKGNGGCFIV